MRLYIDPGTGSMLFAVLIGVIGALGYMLRIALLKMKTLFGRGKTTEGDHTAIPFVIHSENKRYYNIFLPLLREFEKRGTDVVYYASSEDDPVFKAGFEHIRPQFIGSGNKAFTRLNFVNADIVLSTTPGLQVYQWKRSRRAGYYAHILHAVGEVLLYRMFGLDYYDGILLASDFQVADLRKLEKLRGMPEKDVCICGIPYMDDLKARLEKCDPLEEHEKTILLAPSWGQSAIFARFGGRIIDELLKTHYHIIIRPHPQSFTSEKELMDSLMKAYPESERLEWNRDTDNFEVLRRSDILISDFSGVTFEFALGFDRPVIYTDTDFDLSPYDAWWLGDHIWTQDALPRIGKNLKTEALDRLGSLIEECIDSEELQRGRDEVRRECWQCMGTGAKEAVDFLIQKQTELSEKKGR